MKKAHILHNPKAGSQEHSKKDLVAILKTKGYKCGYSSTKQLDWKSQKPKTDFLIIAGGDGTVRKVIVELINKNKKVNLPVLLLPLGTANNIAKSLDLEAPVEKIVSYVDKGKVKKFDVGFIEGKKKKLVFLESFGFGVFPALMKRMEEIPEREDATPEENIHTALKELHNIIMNYAAQPYTVVIDGVPNTDHYILIEIMNISSIGPNLNISPNGDPGDGEFELIMIPEHQRQEFADYVTSKMNGAETTFVPVVIKGKRISIATPAGFMHIDDELKYQKKPKKLTVTVAPGTIAFFVQ